MGFTAHTGNAEHRRIPLSSFPKESSCSGIRALATNTRATLLTQDGSASLKPSYVTRLHKPGVVLLQWEENPRLCCSGLVSSPGRSVEIHGTGLSSLRGTGAAPPTNLGSSRNSRAESPSPPLGLREAALCSDTSSSGHWLIPLANPGPLVFWGLEGEHRGRVQAEQSSPQIAPCLATGHKGARAGRLHPRA